MIFLNLTFDELCGLFFYFVCLIMILVAVFNGFMDFFEFAFDGKIKRLFHYHYHYKDRRK